MTKKELKELTDFIDKYGRGCKYIVKQDGVYVAGGFYCSHNQLKSLPESIGNMKVGGDFYCSYNQLTSLPESIGNMKVGGNFSCFNNKLTSLPESIGNMKVGGNFYCSYKLTSLPDIQRMAMTIEPDWCFVDGIVREIVNRRTVNGLTILETPFDFIAGDGEAWAHGKTIKEAIADYRFKLMELDCDSLKDLDLDEMRPIEDCINIYRVVTRSCREGIRQWMNGKSLPSKLTLNQAMKLTKGAYGGAEFATFFGVEK